MWITPTVGRVVWFHDYAQGTWAGQTLAAIVTAVWSDTCVNLAVFDPNGNTFGSTSVLLVQEGNARPDHGFCEWMPYQIGQAARTQAAEAKVAA